MRSTILFAFLAVAALALGAAVASPSDTAGTVSEMAKAGPYTVTLKVLPAESFAGPEAEMAWDGGASPVKENGSEHPNRHMVVFVERDGKPVENATVDIRYRRLSPEKSEWEKLPVARMHVAGKGPESTHYGNNVSLAPGRWSVDVDVDGRPATFHFTLATS